MSFYLFNSPVLTAWGKYDYQGPLNTQQARLLLPADFISAIGHESTAILLSELLQCSVPMNRTQVVMQTGDQALVFRLSARPPEGRIMNTEELQQTGYVFGLLRKLA